VLQLAADLAIAGVPVWLDSWELGPGDSLMEKIQTGVTISSFVIVVVSPASLKSKWVRQELKAGLLKEAKTKQVVIIPIQIGQSPLPLAIRGRIYADFTNSYRSPFERLLKHLTANGAIHAPVPADKRIIPLRFSGQVYLKDGDFEAGISRVLESPARVRTSAGQFVVMSDPIYEKLRTAFLERLDHIRSDPYWSYEFERSFESYYERVRLLESGLRTGIEQIVNELPQQPGFPKESVTSACHQFAKFIQAELMGILHFCQNPNLPAIARAPEWLISPFELTSLRVLFQNRSLEPVDIGLPIRDDSDPRFPGFVSGLYASFPVYIDELSSEYRELYRWTEYVPGCVGRVFSGATISDFVVPQMMYRALITKTVTPVWDFTSLYYGRH
jgi:hypothetical protein